MANKQYDENNAPTLTKAGIAEILYDEIGLPKKHSISCVENIIDHIKEALEEGESVKISGFGVFQVREKSGRLGRNPKTLDEVKIQPRSVVTYRISNLFKSELNR